MLGKTAEFIKIADQIANRINMGDFGENGKLPAERELAEDFNVSRVTLRAALKELEEKGLVTRVHGSGTFVNSDETKKTLTNNEVCFIFELIGKPVAENPFTAMCLDGIGRASVKKGFKFNLLPMPEHMRLTDYLRNCPALMPDSKAVVLKYDKYYQENAEFLKGRGHIVVLLGPADEKTDLSFVDIDNFSGGTKAASHLIRSGRKNIAYMDGPLSDPSVLKTFSGIQTACLQEGAPFNMKLLKEITPWEEESAYLKMKELLDSQMKVDGIIVRGDMASLGAVKAIREAGLKIPQDISFVMYDDFAWVHRACGINLTAVRQPFDKYSEAAADIADEAMKKISSQKTVRIFEPDLIIRES